MLLSTSYESYAPRSAEQRARLARIASLTAGPSYHDINDSSSKEENIEEEKYFTLTEAMCPPIGIVTNNIININNDYGGGNNNNKLSPIDETLQQTIQKTSWKKQLAKIPWELLFENQPYPEYKT